MIWEESDDSAIKSESDEELDDNAITEEESDEGDWEDDNKESVPRDDEKPLFQRVDSKPNLDSRRSLLTTLMHQGDHALTFATRRSRTRTHNGPSTGNLQRRDGGRMMRQQATRTKPIMATCNHAPMLSPRTTRRNMLQTEFTQSLLHDLRWEQQQKNSVINAINKRVQSAASIPTPRSAMTTNNTKGMEAHLECNLVQYMTQSATIYKDTTKSNNPFNEYFDQGLQEYHQKGW